MLTDFQKLMLPRDGSDIIFAVERPRLPGVGSEPSEVEAILAFRQAHAKLRLDLLQRIHAEPPAFFEELVIDVLLAAGYGARRRDLAKRLGRSGDGGVDGVIALDELGLDQIYIQAKRLKPGCVVPVSDVRDFVGSLDAHRAAKGTLLTTAHFSQPAIDFCAQVSRRVVLIDGLRLADLMIRYNIGVNVVESYQLKQINSDYFLSMPLQRTREMISASSQPRR